MSKTARLWLFVVLAVGVVFGANSAAASARTYEHGRTILFGDHKISSDDLINGDLNIVFGNVVCDNGAVIRGDVRIYGGHFTALDGCEVGGELVDLGAGQVITLLPWPIAFASDRAVLEQNQAVLTHLAYAVLVLFAFLLFPVRVRVALERVEKHPGLSALTGTLAVVAVIPLAILLLLSIIGIPLIVVEIAAVCGGLWIGQAAVAILVGRRLSELLRPHTTPSPLGALVLGLVVIAAAAMLPVFGWAVTAIVSLVGIGAAILAFVRETAFSHSLAPPPIGGPPMRAA
jgi:hypothetical protein